MDSTTMIVTAVATEATAATALTDAYRELRQLLIRVAGTNPQAEVVLAGYESDPDTWQAPMRKLLSETGADRNAQVIAAARQLLELADPEGSRTGKYVIDARGAHIGVIGDHAVQNSEVRTVEQTATVSGRSTVIQVGGDIRPWKP